MACDHTPGNRKNRNDDNDSDACMSTNRSKTFAYSNKEDQNSSYSSPASSSFTYNSPAASSFTSYATSYKNWWSPGIASKSHSYLPREVVVTTSTQQQQQSSKANSVFASEQQPLLYSDQATASPRYYSDFNYSMPVEMTATSHSNGGSLKSPEKRVSNGFHTGAEVIHDPSILQHLQVEDASISQETEMSTTTTIETSTTSTDKLGVVPLAVLIFYSVSGGPFGCEASVRSGGNLYTLLGFAIMPLVWSIQEAFLTAELASALGEAAGGVAWVAEAFGQRAGWMAGYLGWVAGATDNAIYPVLFLDYVMQIWKNNASSGNVAGDAEDDEMNFWLRFALLSTMSICLAYVNWLGLNVVGSMSIVICLIAMSPFIILVVVGSFKVQPYRWFLPPQEDVQTLVDATDDDGVGGGFFPNASWGGVLWRPFLNNLFWNLNSFDAAAAFSADIEGNPATVWPRAMTGAVIMVFACYFFPLLIALGASDDPQHAWVDGYLATVARQVVGPWLGDWTVFAAGISNLAMFQAELSADAFQLMGMADRGYVPEILSTRSRHGTPTYGIIVGTAVIVCMAVSDLDQLIEMLNFNYAISLLMEYGAFLKLRISRPDLERPYKIPLSTTGCIILFIPTFVFTFIVLGLATYTTYAFVLVVNLVGLLLYHLRQQPSVMISMNSVGSLCASMCSRDKYTVVVENDTATSSGNNSECDDGVAAKEMKTKGLPNVC